MQAFLFSIQLLCFVFRVFSLLFSLALAKWLIKWQAYVSLMYTIGHVLHHSQRGQLTQCFFFVTPAIVIILQFISRTRNRKTKKNSRNQQPNVNIQSVRWPIVLAILRRKKNSKQHFFPLKVRSKKQWNGHRENAEQPRFSHLHSWPNRIFFSRCLINEMNGMFSSPLSKMPLYAYLVEMHT